MNRRKVGNNSETLGTTIVVPYELQGVNHHYEQAIPLESRD